MYIYIHVYVYITKSFNPISSPWNSHPVSASQVNWHEVMEPLLEVGWFPATLLGKPSGFRDWGHWISGEKFWWCKSISWHMSKSGLLDGRCWDINGYSS